MVLVECKRLPKEEYSKDFDVFILSTPATSNVGDVTDAVQKMQNTRVRVQWMIAAAKQLAKDSCTEENQHHLFGAVKDAESYISPERATRREACTQEELDTIIQTFKGAVAILFPAECSGSDACQRLSAVLEDDTHSDVEKSQAHRILSIIDDGAVNEASLIGPVTMWWSAKPMSRDADLAKYVGKNEKTKITVKLTADGAPAPAREPVIDARAQADLMARYYKQQEEAKKMIEDEDLSFANSEWANPRGLKGQLMGMDSIKFKPS